MTGMVLRSAAPISAAPNNDVIARQLRVLHDASQYAAAEISGLMHRNRSAPPIGMSEHDVATTLARNLEPVRPEDPQELGCRDRRQARGHQTATRTVVAPTSS